MLRRAANTTAVCVCLLAIIVETAGRKKSISFGVLRKDSLRKWRFGGNLNHVEGRMERKYWAEGRACAKGLRQNVQLREKVGKVLCSRAQRESRGLGIIEGGQRGRFHIKDLSLHPKSYRKPLTVKA